VKNQPPSYDVCQYKEQKKNILNVYTTIVVREKIGWTLMLFLFILYRNVNAKICRTHTKRHCQHWQRCSTGMCGGQSTWIQGEKTETLWYIMVVVSLMLS